MGNVTHILPVLHCLKRGIAFVSSLFIYYRQDLPGGQLCRYFVYSRADFGVFRPSGATRCTDQGQIWQGGPLLPAKFDLDRFTGGGLRPPKLKKNPILLI